jgi:hypothetical protein
LVSFEFINEDGHTLKFEGLAWPVKDFWKELTINEISGLNEGLDFEYLIRMSDLG